MKLIPAIVVDTETTGLDTSKDQILEIAAVRFADGKVNEADSFLSLVKPGIAIPPASTAIHTITDDDVAHADEFGQVIPRFSEWAGNSVMIGYSLGFDLAMLKAEHQRCGLKWISPRSLDVRQLVQIVGPDLPEQSLETTAGWLGLEVTDRHRAMGDALLTARIFETLIPKLKDLGLQTLSQVERACINRVSQREQETRAGWVDVVSSDRTVPRSVAAYARIDSFPYRHRVRDIMHSPPATIASSSSLKTALSLMMERRISSLFVEGPAAKPAWGILTERDVLRAIDAGGASALKQTVAGLAVYPLVTIAEEEFIYRAILSMARHGFRHLGVVDSQGALVGALSARDLLKQRADDAMSLGDGILRAESTEELGVVWAGLTTVARGLVSEDVDPRDIAAVISRELRALTGRACDLAEQEMVAEGNGEPPTPYAMFVLGSGGRGESLLAMDQDNAIVFAAGEPGGEADQWFEDLGQKVAVTLNEAGVVFCKGGIMASNAQWRMNASRWRDTVSEWLSKSRPGRYLEQ